MVVYIIVAALAVMLASLAGVVFVQKSLSRVLERNLKVLIAFAFGVFAVLVYSLFAETIAIGTPLPLIIAFALFGALFLEIVDRLIHRGHHHHHHHETCDDYTHGTVDAHRILMSDAVHNVSDGIILVPAFLTDVWVGISAAVGIFLHELAQEIAEFFVLKEAGYSTKKALVWNFAVSATIFIGIALAVFAASMERFEAPLLAFAAGGIVYVILRDLLPSVVCSIRERGKAPRFVGAALVGALLLLSIQILVPHEPEERHNNENTEDSVKTVIMNINTVPPEGSTSDDIHYPAKSAVDAVRAYAARLFNVSESAVITIAAEPREWKDSCLGLSGEGEFCAQVITPGWEITVTVNGAEHVFRTNRDGTAVREEK